MGWRLVAHVLLLHGVLAFPHGSVRGITPTLGVVSPVPSLNASSYLGRWYQAFASATVKDTMELGGNCVVADYGLVPNRSDAITVANICRPLGIPVTVSGYAVRNPSQQGELSVVLGPPGHPPHTVPKAYGTTNYVVSALGPV